MRAKLPSRSTRANRAVSKTRPKLNDKKVENGDCGSKKSQPIVDFAVLRQPIDTSVAGLKQACKLFETGTPEMVHILNYECDIVYECKVCRNLFRSLANLISHKRVYCTKHYSRSQDLLSLNQQVEDHTVIVETKNSVIDRPSRITALRDLTSIVETISKRTSASQFYTEAANKVTARNSARKETLVHLQPMENTTFGVFQTVVSSPTKELMKNQVTELHSLLSEEENVPTLGPDGRILTNGVCDKKEEKKESKQLPSGLVCPKCNLKFLTRKTMTQHIKIVHESVRVCYSCPCCKNLFANTWSVYRHLYKVHKKTNEQVKKLRSQIQKKEVKIDKNKASETQNKASKNQTEQNRLEQENKAWMEHFEGDFDLQRCGGCGRRFERKAALTSHSQICQKRIAACNRIQKEPDLPSKLVPVPIPPSKPAIPKIQNEKKIGIQVRMNYCKTGSSSTTQSEERRSTRLGLGDESDIEVTSVDGKYAPSSHSSIKDPTEVRNNLGIDNYFCMQKTTESAESINKVKVYLNNFEPNRKKEEDINVKNNTISNYFPKLSKLEAKCLQLQKACEVDNTEVLEGVKEKQNCYDSQIEETVCDSKTEDNTSEDVSPMLCDDNTSTAFDCKNDCIIPDNVPDEIILTKDEPIKSDLPEHIKLPEVCTSSISSGESVEIIYEQTSISEIKSSIENNDNSNEPVTNTCEETKQISTSILSTENVPNIQSEIIHMNDESGSSKENHIESCLPDIKNQTEIVVREDEFLLENTISILTRNQLRAICKDVVLKVENSKEPQTTNSHTSDALKTNNEENNHVFSWINKKLAKHMRTRKLQCLICMKKYRTHKSLRIHVAEHAGWKRFRCVSSDCTFSCYSKTDCISHVLKTHLKSNEKDVALTMISEINPSEWKLNFNFNKSYPVAGVKPVNLRNSARLKTKNIQCTEIKNSPNRIKVVEKTDINKTSRYTQRSSTENIVSKPVTKRRRVKEENDQILSDDCISNKGSRRTSISNSVAQVVDTSLSLNLVPNSNPDSIISTEEEVMSSDLDDSRVMDESQDPDNSSNLQELVMEVIFGTNNAAANSSLVSGRPVRNKVRPKRDSDFIFENQIHKDSLLETNNSRNGPLRKSLRIPDLKMDVESPKKMK